MNQPTCSTCAHRAPHPDMQMVECRRFPPALHIVPQPGGQAMVTSFPQPRRDWWCSEHTPEVAE